MADVPLDEHRLQQMLPRFSRHDCVKRRVVNSEHASKRRLGKRRVERPNSADFLIGQFCTVTSLPGRHSAFGDHVFDVVQLRAKEEVVRVDAVRVVASMENEQFIRNRPFADLPGNPRSQVRNASFVRNIDIEATSTRSVRRPSPGPAAIRLLHVFPKPLLDGKNDSARRFVIALFGTILPAYPKGAAAPYTAFFPCCVHLSKYTRKWRL